MVTDDVPIIFSYASRGWEPPCISCLSMDGEDDGLVNLYILRDVASFESG